MDRQKPRDAPVGIADFPVGNRPYLLPADLAKALSWLSDDELETLQTAAEREKRRRSAAGGPSSSAGPVRRPKPANQVGPRIGQINAIRAALEAGVKPGMVAKQFGVSKTIVAEVGAGSQMRKAIVHDN